jgi:hypothetical protein
MLRRTDRIVFRGTPTTEELDRLHPLVADRHGELGKPGAQIAGQTIVPVHGLSHEDLLAVHQEAVDLRLDVIEGRYYFDTSRPPRSMVDWQSGEISRRSHSRVPYGVDRGHGDGWRQLDDRFIWRMPGWQPIERTDRRPVVAVVDSGVLPHPEFPAADPDDPFLLTPLDTGSPAPGSDPAADEHLQPVSGHATFIAGLIRFIAPTAQVLSVDVMNELGVIDEIDLKPALQQLLSYRTDGNPLDIVTMSFGRHRASDEDPRDLQEIEDLLAALAAQGVRLVASAGNYGIVGDDDTSQAQTPVYPAVFPGVTAVGAGRSADDREDYSSYGDWVQHWRPGTAISVMPADRWATWTGTSFSAAVYAAELAARLG